MTKREEGFYWVKLRSTSEPRVALWMTGLWCAGNTREDLWTYDGQDYKDSEVTVLSERLEPPHA